jgi:aryl-alcohol dehydrogenase-like predicted oxidoreductase
MHRLETTTLGNTGITVTRLSAGGHFTNGPTAHEDIPRRVAEIHHEIDRGLTYHDVQWDPEELAMAEVLKTRASEITVAWPLHGVTALGGDVTAQYVVDYCHDHQNRYGISHVNILLWIALEIQPDTQEKAVCEVRKGFEILNREGFCDFLGFSCHHSPEMAMQAISNFDDFAVMMVPYGMLNPGAGRGLLAFARSKGIGTVGMKPFCGGGGFYNAIWSGHAGLEDLRESGKHYQAGIKWVLADKYLDCTVPGLHSITEIDEAIAAAFELMTPEDKSLLATIRTAFVESGGNSGAWA